MRKIIEVQFIPSNIEQMRNHSSILATFDDKLEKTLFNYYPDEIHFKSSELIGLTEQEAINLKIKKNKHFLQS